MLVVLPILASAALIADGYHARTDGWTSLAVLGGAVGVWLGFPVADPIIGLLITAAILVIVWRSMVLNPTCSRRCSTPPRMYPECAN